MTFMSRDTNLTLAKQEIYAQHNKIWQVRSVTAPTLKFEQKYRLLSDYRFSRYKTTRHTDLFMVCNLLCVTRKIYTGTVYTTIILKDTKYTLLCQYLFLLAVGGNATRFDHFLCSSSGVQKYWY
jgi:hypothetical protein